MLGRTISTHWPRVAATSTVRTNTSSQLTSRSLHIGGQVRTNETEGDLYTEMTTQIGMFERLIIESQSNCNRSCWFCPRTYDRSGKYLDAKGKSVLSRMPTEKILDLLDQARQLNFSGLVGFHHYSEPLLDDRAVQLAREAKKRGMKPYLYTNGDPMKKNERLCQEVKHTYARIVIGLYDYENDEELGSAKEFWLERLQGAAVEFNPVGLQGRGVVSTNAVPRALVPFDSRMSIPDLSYENAPCHRPLIRLIVQYDGQMCNCCEDTYGAFDLGNIYESSLEELWFSERHAEILQHLVLGRREHYPLCRDCPMPPTGKSQQPGKRIEIRPRLFSSAVGRGGT